MRHLKNKSRKHSGFTLVEIMVVVVILGLLATVVTKNVFPLLFGAKIDKAKADISVLAEAVELYRLTNKGRAPESLEELIEPDENGNTILKNLTEVPVDPWDNEYTLDEDPDRRDGFIITSWGPDKEADTDDDITNLNMNKRDDE